MTWAIQGCYTQASVEELAHSHLGSARQAKVDPQADCLACLARARLWIAARAWVRCFGRIGRLSLLSLLVLVCFGPAGAAAQVVHPSEVPCPRKRVVSGRGPAGVACAIVREGTLKCWGPPWFDRVRPAPAGEFVEITDGGSLGGYACALAPSGTVRCWSWREGVARVPVPGAFVQVVVGRDHACGLRPNGTVECWGRGELRPRHAPRGGSPLEPPPTQFVQICAGEEHNCGVRRDGKVECWGRDDFFQSTAPPEEIFEEVACGGMLSCGLKLDGTVFCWGFGSLSNPWVDFGPRLGRRFTKLEADRLSFCALKEDGKIACEFGFPTVQPTVLVGPWVDVSLGGFGVCGVRPDGSLRCSGRELGGTAASPPSGRFRLVSAGRMHTCALDLDGQAHCWGENDSGQASPPPGLFEELAAGGVFTCGLRPDGTVECWGAGVSDWRAVPVPAGQFQKLTAGTSHACAISVADGRAYCWGSQRAVAAAPTEEWCVREIAAGGNHTCMVTCDRRLVCSRGDMQPGGEEVPGRFTHVSVASAGYSVGYEASLRCATRVDGTLHCTLAGSPELPPELEPPRGIFSSVTIGASLHACALAQDGAVTCWGANGLGQASPPPGPFVQVSAGGAHTCGLRPDGTIECWGGERVLDGIVVRQDTPCVPIPTGDCNGDGFVDIDELVRLVNIALGQERTEASCPSGDANGDGAVSVDEILTAVGRALELG